MRTFASVAAAADEVDRFFLRNEESLPEHVRDKIEPLTRRGSSPVDLIVVFTESVYANQKAVPKEAIELAAGLADLIDQDGYHGRLNDRATAMSKALRRESGEKAGAAGWPKKEDDPEPNKDFVPAPPPPPAPAADEPGK